MKQKNEETHITGYRNYLLVWLGLMIFTVLTVAVARIDLGSINLLAAMLIASFKALLVIVFFMHLLYEQRLFKIMVIFTVITLAIFIGLTFFDVPFR